MKNCNSSVLLALSAMIAMGGSTAVFSAVSAEEAKQLGGETLTVFGAEKVGNKEGTIPAYTGERLPIPASTDPKEPGFIADPFAAEKPLFSITAQNAAQYGDKLTEGQKAFFRKFPNYRMDIYPTHRTHVYPKFILDNTLKNAAVCKTADGGDRIEGCWGGIPFPIAKNGHEMMWNHSLRWVAHDFGGTFRTIHVNGSNGSVTNQGDQKVWITASFFDPKQTKPWPNEFVYWKLRFDAFGPPRRAGEKTLLTDSLDPKKPGRRAYQYIPGQRRVKLAPDLAYDTPNPVGGGSSTLDESYLFYGALDRYDYKLVTKKETFINYNNFKILDYNKCPESVIATKNFPNPDCVRWELHRTWVVEAKLKPGFRHIYPRRTMYFDEDNLGAGVSDNYDASNNLYRITNMLTYPLPGENAGSAAENSYHIDMQTGHYALLGMLGMKGSGWYVMKPIDPFVFSPEAMAGEGIR